MICTMLHFVISVSLDIRRVGRYVCFWPLWFSKLLFYPQWSSCSGRVGTHGHLLDVHVGPYGTDERKNGRTPGLDP